jgi:diguanylate cyclase (GGDEF)-like protein
MTGDFVSAVGGFLRRRFPVPSLWVLSFLRSLARRFPVGFCLSVSFFLWTAAGNALDMRPSPNVTSSASPVVRYGMVEHPPLFFRDAQGTYQGFFVDLLRYVAEREGWRLEFTEAPGERLVEMLQAGELDLLSMAPTPRLERLFDFNTVQHHATWYTFFTRPGVQMLTYADLNGRSVAIQRGFYAVSELRYLTEQLGLRCTILETFSMEEAFDLLLRGEADVCAAEQLTALSFARRHNLRRSPVVFAPSRIYFGTTKGRNAAILRALDAHLRELLDSLTSPYYRWQRKWFYDEELTFFPQWALIAFLCSAVFLVLLGAGVVLLGRKERALRKAGERTVRHLAYEKVLSDCARLFLTPGEGEEVLSRVCERLCDLSEVSWVAVYRNQRHAEEGYVAQLVAETGLSLATPHVAQIERMLFREVPREWVAALAEGRPWQEDAGALQEWRELFPVNTGNDSLLLLPLHEGKHWWGTMVFAGARKRLWNAEVTGILETVTNIAGTYLSRRRAEEKLLRLAATDGLTGLSNRRAFFGALEREIARSTRHGSPLSLAILDVDHFKEVNDRYGHDVGDEVLRGLARLLLRGVRKEDFLGRIGGEEFGVLLPEAVDELAFSVAERLRGLVEQHPFSVASGRERHTLHLTVSIGVAPFLGKGDSACHFYRRADGVLYNAKASGRNRVYVWTFPEEPGRARRNGEVHGDFPG